MSSKRFLSLKKKFSQTISLPGSLKTQLNSFFKEIQESSPVGQNLSQQFNSFSSGCCYLMEVALKILSKGIKLEEIHDMVDGELNEFYEQFTFRAYILLFEKILENNRYTSFDFYRSPQMFLAYKQFLQEKRLIRNRKDIMIFFRRIRNLYINQNMVKEFLIELMEEELDQGLHLTIKIVGNHPNLFFERCKLDACILGFFGAEIIKFHYFRNEMIATFYIKITDLVFKRDFAMNERVALLNQNLNHIINYCEIVNDENDIHLFQKLSIDINVFLEFKDFKEVKKILATIEVDARKFGSKDQFLLTLLKFFEKLHWIKIINSQGLKFRFQLDKTKYEEELNFITSYFSKHATVMKVEDTLFLE